MFVITGGGSGIGQALALALSNRGQQVFVIGRNEQTLQQTAESGSNIQYLVADVASGAGRSSIQTRLQNTSLRGFIHNAGILEPIKPLSEITVAEWSQILATNLNAPLFLTQMLGKELKGGRVLNIGSGAAYSPIKGFSAYCVTKAALSMLTRCWQMESSDIAFASVMPGIIDTSMQTKIRTADHMDAAMQDFFINLKNQGQLLRTETVALFLSWLLLDLERQEYSTKEWDIYETSHHHAWLTDEHQVPVLE